MCSSSLTRVSGYDWATTQTYLEPSHQLFLQLQRSTSAVAASLPLICPPPPGAGIKDQAHNTLTNQRLLAGFFSSARPLLSSPLSGPVYTAQGPMVPKAGQLLVTLKSGGWVWGPVYTAQGPMVPKAGQLLVTLKSGGWVRGGGREGRGVRKFRFMLGVRNWDHWYAATRISICFNSFPPCLTSSA